MYVEKRGSKSRKRRKSQTLAHSEEIKLAWQLSWMHVSVTIALPFAVCATPTFDSHST